MYKIISLIITILLLLIAEPAFAACPAIPALPDTERRTEYSGISNQTGPFNVGFALYGEGSDYGNWLEVWVINTAVTPVTSVKLTPITDFTVTSPSGALQTLCLPITNAQVNFTAPQSGKIEIVGARRPRRTSQLQENAGVTAHDFNQLNSDIIAVEREFWDLKSRLIIQAPGTGPVQYVASIGGMTGVINCAPSLICANQTVDLNLAHSNLWTAVQNTRVDANSDTVINVTNLFTGTGALAAFSSNNDVGAATSFGTTSSTYNALPILGPGKSFLFSGSVPLVIDVGAAQPIIFGINNVEVARFQSTGLTLSGITGSTQCLQAGPSGLVSGAGVACGGGSLPQTHILVGNASNVAADFGSFITATNTPNARLTISSNTVGPVQPFTDASLQIMGADGGLARVVIDAFATGQAGPIIQARYARSPASNPGAVHADDVLMILAATGWNGSAYSNTSPQIHFRTSEAWDASHSGSLIRFFTAPSGSAITFNAATVQPSGGFSVGSADAGTDGGNGIIVAKGLTLSGIAAVGPQQCLQISSLGVVNGSGSACGSGGGGAVNSVTNADSTLTIAPTTGAVVASLNLAHANIWTGVQTINAATGPQIIVDSTGRFSELGFNHTGTLQGAVYWDNAVPAMVNYSAGSEDFNTGGVVSMRLWPSGGLSVGTANAAVDGGSGILVSTGARFTGGSTTGATRCLHVDTAGNVSGTASDCGATAVGGGVTGVTSPGGTLTVGGTTGVTVDLNLAHANTWTAVQNTSITSNGGAVNGITNGSNGTSALAGWQANNDVGGGVSFGITSSAYNALPILGPGKAFLFSGTIPFIIDVGAAQPIMFGINNVEVARFNGTGLGIQPSGQGVTPDAPLTINMNTVQSLTGPPAGTALHIIGANDTITYLTMDTIGTNAVPLILGRNAIGTRAVPLPLIAGSQGLNLSGYGWNGTAYTPLASIVFTAGETLSASNNGSNINFYTNTLGVPNFNVVMRIQPSGGLSVGTGNVTTDGGNGVIVANDVTWAGSAFTAFTPAVTATTGTFGSVSATSVYKKFGKLVIYKVSVFVTTLGTAAGRMLITLPLPVAPTPVTQYVVGGIGANTVTHKAVIATIFDSLTALSVNYYDGAFPSVGGGDGVNFLITYETP